jgi:recombination protein RecA
MCFLPWSASSLRLHVESALAGRVVSPFRFKEAAAPAVVPTGVSALDELAGGLPRGCLTEIYGPPCSGKSSILQSALAKRTKAAEACALVDAQDAFDPIGAGVAGVELSRLLWVRCQGMDPALRSLDLLLHSGGFGFVALDLGDIPARLVRQVQLNVWFRMRRAVEDTSTVFVVLAQESNAKSCASLVLRVEREATQWSSPIQKNSKKAAHTPGCLLEGSTNSAEMVRSFLRHKKPLFIDRPKVSGSAGTAHFQLGSDQQVKKEKAPEAEFFPAAEAMSERS